jgi:5-methylcytosine-specific restriction enzyme subunit McrC
VNERRAPPGEGGPAVPRAPRADGRAPRGEGGEPLTVTLTEWGRLLLPGRWLRGEEARAAAAKLTDEGRLEVRELLAGLELTARSYVGDVDLGDLRVRIVPKLNPDALRRLLAFSHGAGAGPGEDGPGGPAELLTARLIVEVEGLLLRGLEGDYLPRKAALPAPRGRLDLRALAARGGLVDASLPCEFAERGADTALNRALLAGLDAATTVAPALAPRAAPLRALLRRSVTPTPLDEALLRAARARIHAGARAYLPALELIEALARGQVGVGGVLPAGFLFDMNRFFQAVVARLLRGHLRGWELHEEWVMQDLLRYAPDANPHQRRAPLPRPDFALFSSGKLVAILDAKYRDLWAEPLPREMLYQLALYAIGHGQASIIVYPSDDPYAREARVELREPTGPWGFRTVALRPLGLTRLAELSGTPTGEARRALEALAAALVAPVTPGTLAAQQAPTQPGPAPSAPGDGSGGGGAGG